MCCGTNTALDFGSHGAAIGCVLGSSRETAVSAPSTLGSGCRAWFFALHMIAYG
jgi:hypothetical protein